MRENQSTSLHDNDHRESYERPVVKRWGTLRELTRGGGGNKREPVTKLRTRF